MSDAKTEEEAVWVLGVDVLSADVPTRREREAAGNSTGETDSAEVATKETD
jgi:hypothetical protein